MKSFIEKFKRTFAAVSFAEQGEWEDAIKIAEGKITFRAADGIQKKTPKKAKRRSVDTRPQLKL